MKPPTRSGVAALQIEEKLLPNSKSDAARLRQNRRWTRIIAGVWVALSVAMSAQADSYSGPFGDITTGAIRKLPNAGRPLTKTPFPGISDWGSLKITLKRTVCYGTCPDYVVEIDGNGSVSYEGHDFVAVSGKHTSQIPIDTVRDLFNAFASADFFWMLDEYRSNITDNPTYTLSLSFDSHAKKVVDYAGRLVGMPREITQLENAVDAAANIKKWTEGDATTFGSLQAEHWDFAAKDDEHESLIASAATKGDIELARRLLSMGVSARNKFGCRGLESAAYAGNLGLVHILLSAGAPIHCEDTLYGQPMTHDALSGAATSGMPEVVRAILDQHPDVNWRDQGGRTPLMRAAEGTESKNGRDFAAIVKMLLDAGANVNAQDENGRTALTGMLINAGVARALLAAGAKGINDRNFRGETPIFRCYKADVAEVLLEAGADPWIVNDEGKNALEVVRRTYGDNVPAGAVLEHWMAAHPRPH